MKVKNLVKSDSISVGGKEDETVGEKKKIYVYFQYIGGFAWCKLNVEDDNRITGAVVPELTSFPSAIQNLSGYANTVCKSLIFFLGGQDDKFDLKDSAYAFNTKDGKWQELPPMLEVRTDAKAVVAKNIIYVFGCVYSNLPPDVWAEAYDIKGEKWFYLPPPPVQIDDVRSAVVNPTNNEILLWATPKNEICSFNYDTGTWISTVDLNYTIFKVPSWSFRVAIVEDVLFWHFAGDMYALDLIKRRLVSIAPLCTVVNPCFEDYAERHPNGRCCDPVPTFLVYVGDGILLLIWPDMAYKKQSSCRKIKVQVKRQGEEVYVHLAWEGDSILSREYSYISDVVCV